MQLTKGQRIAGRPVVAVRNALRHLRDGSWGSKAISVYFKVSTTRARQIALQLAKHGYIERDHSIRQEEAWRLTDAGRALTNANAMRPLAREKAGRLIQECLERVREINSNPHFLYRISKVIVFGSYLSKKETLGDIDLAVELTPKEHDQDRFSKLVLKRSEEAMGRGRRFSTFLDQLAWAETEVRRFLRGGVRHLSLHSTNDAVLKTCATRKLFPAPAGRRKRRES